MAKRFTDTDKWKDPWFQDLPLEYKCFWFYILDQCTAAGIWKVNIRLASYQTGFDYQKENILSVFQDRINVINSEKWFIKKFVDFQYGTLSENCKPHISVILELKKERVYKGYMNSLERVKEKDKEKDKDKDINNITKNNNNTIQESAEKKIKYAEFVTMKEPEYQTLVDQHGEDFVRECIKILDNYKGATGKKYKSDYRAILNWVISEAKKRGVKHGTNSKSSEADIERDRATLQEFSPNKGKYIISK